MAKRILKLLLVLLLVLIAIIAVKTLTFSSKQITVAPVKHLEVSDSAVERFAEVVRIPTVSYEDSSRFTAAPFDSMHAVLKRNYPLVDSILSHETVNQHSLLYTWQGTNTTLKPLLLLAHMDVVPVEDNSLSQWTEPPFSGAIKDGFVWGRGSMDDKLSVIGIMEAVESLLKQGYKPERTIYLAFGHDEEISGRNGAVKIAELLKKRGVQAELALDEGMAITKGLVPAIKKPVALIGIAEKGFLTIKLRCHVEGGHSSMPEKETNIGILSTAIAKLQANPFPARISEPTQDFINYVGPEMSPLFKALFANMWLFKGVFMSEMGKTASGSATLRTTTAPTVFKSGVKENVLPSEATAMVNFRILPGETVESVMAHVKEIIGDNRVEVKAGDWAEGASKVSSINSAGFNEINTTIKQLWPDAVVAPSLVLGGTDSRHYSDVADNVYRFQPLVLTSEDLVRIHGINERMGIQEFKDAVGFYYQFIINFTGKQSTGN